MTKRRQCKSGMSPLPSLIRASAFDAGNSRMRAAGRSKWNVGDYNECVRVQERLIVACYGREGDADPRTKYIRFSLAEQLQKQGDFDLRSDLDEIFAWIEDCLTAPVEAAA